MNNIHTSLLGGKFSLFFVRISLFELSLIKVCVFVSFVMIIIPLTSIIATYSFLCSFSACFRLLSFFSLLLLVFLFRSDWDWDSVIITDKKVKVYCYCHCHSFFLYYFYFLYIHNLHIIRNRNFIRIHLQHFFWYNRFLSLK